MLVRLRLLFEDPEPSRRAVLAMLFGRETAVATASVREALEPPDVDRLVGLGLVRPVDGGYAPLARLDRVGGLVLASDLLRRRRQRDFVVPPGPASFLLGAFVRAARGEHALDLGCGSGIQALRLAADGAAVVAFDINPRALGFARFNAALNGFRTIDPVEGDFLGPGRDRSLDGRFDLVVGNPPFVLSPSHELVYRDRPLPGDEVTRRTVDRAARALAPGGRGFVLGNWIDRGGAWSDPVREWVRHLGVDACAIRIGSFDASTYAATWTRDLPAPERPAAAAAWAAALRADGSETIHVGVVAIARPARGRFLRRRRFLTLDRASQRVTREAVEAMLAA